jgi:hypothetical protein
MSCRTAARWWPPPRADRCFGRSHSEAGLCYAGFPRMRTARLASWAACQQKDVEETELSFSLQVLVWDMRGGHAPVRALGAHGPARHPLLASFRLRDALARVPELASQAPLPASPLHALLMDPRDSCRAAFSLACGWAGAHSTPCPLGTPPCNCWHVLLARCCQQPECCCTSEGSDQGAHVAACALQGWWTSRGRRSRMPTAQAAA